MANHTLSSAKAMCKQQGMHLYEIEEPATEPGKLSLNKYRGYFAHEQAKIDDKGSKQKDFNPEDVKILAKWLNTTPQILRCVHYHKLKPEERNTIDFISSVAVLMENSPERFKAVNLEQWSENSPLVSEHHFLSFRLYPAEYFSAADELDEDDIAKKSLEKDPNMAYDGKYSLVYTAPSFQVSDETLGDGYLCLTKCKAVFPADDGIKNCSVYALFFVTEDTAELLCQSGIQRIKSDGTGCEREQPYKSYHRALQYMYKYLADKQLAAPISTSSKEKLDRFSKKIKESKYGR